MLMLKTDEFIKNRIRWKANKFELPTKFAFYYEDLSSDIKQYLNQQIDTEKSGAPVLFFTKPTKEWTLVCARQIFCNDNSKTISLNLVDIERILPTAFDPTLLGKTIDISKVKKKTDWDTIKVIDKRGNSNILYADKGSDLFSLWNILLMAIRLHG